VRARHVVVAAAALLALAGCSAKNAADAATKTPVAVSETSASKAPAVTASASADTDTLDATSDYLTGLSNIDKRLVADPDAALDKGAATCVDIVDKKPTAELETNIVTRFGVTPAQAKLILALAKADLCI
jgi:hypothetical protein